MTSYWGGGRTPTNGIRLLFMLGFAPKVGALGVLLAIAPALPGGTYFWCLEAPTVGALISYMTAMDGGNTKGL